VERSGLEQRTTFDHRNEEATGSCAASKKTIGDNIPAAPGEPARRLFRIWSPTNALVFADESHARCGRIGGLFKGRTFRRKETAWANTLRAALRMDNLRCGRGMGHDCARNRFRYRRTPSAWELNESGRVSSSR